ncbi:MAG: hypothetical protein JNL69_01710 [Bacteroidia bacterium]|nr:hypothetical protein [Bacteroidia bacterium]
MEKNKKQIVAVIIVLFLLFPMIYLFVKSSSTNQTDAEQATVNSAATTDILTLEAEVAANPNYTNLINLSMAYINSNKPGKSIDHLRKAIGLNPKSAVAYNNLGVAHIMLMQYKEGIEACTKALEIDPEFQLAKNNLKWGMDEKEKVMTIINSQDRFPEKDRNNAFYIEYGLNYFKIGDYSKSIEIWNKAFDLDNKSTIALNNIGTAFMMKNQINDAIAVFNQCIKIDENNQLAKNNLKWAMGEKEKLKK